MTEANPEILGEYFNFLKNSEFPCIAAKAAIARQQAKCMIAGHMACPEDDGQILQFLYSFAEAYRSSKEFYHSAAVIFSQRQFPNEEIFDSTMWLRLQALSDLDAKYHGYDKRVNTDPSSPQFSFSIKEEAFYIIGLHPLSSRKARRFKYPALVFNPHHQFEELRQTSKYEAMKQVVRKRDIALSGSINPMLEDFGKASEVFQYSGRVYADTWQCPLKINHAEHELNTPT
jgi:hypothetical protein